MSHTLPAVASMADEDLLHELLWRQRSGATASDRYRELSAEHARRIREAPDRAARDGLVTPLACGLADSSRPAWVA
jgi:hypothetical protein